VVLADHGPVQESTDDAYIGGEVTTLSAKVAGFIQTVTVADNQSVKTGDLLLKLEDRDYRAQLARAEASVAAQRRASRRSGQLSPTGACTKR